MFLYRLCESSLNAVLLLPESSFQKLCQHPERILIMAEIAKGATYFSQLQERVQLPKATLHRHLRVLESSGWIRVERSGNRSIIKPSAIVYVGFKVENNMLRILRRDVAVICPQCGAFLLRVDQRPTFTTCSGDSCERKLDCLRSLSKLSRRLGLDIMCDELPELILEVFTEIAIREVESIFSTQHIPIPISKSRVLYRELLMIEFT